MSERIEDLSRGRPDAFGHRGSVQGQCRCAQLCGILGPILLGSGDHLDGVPGLVGRGIVALRLQLASLRFRSMYRSIAAGSILTSRPTFTESILRVSTNLRIIRGEQFSTGAAVS
jgi:hypothetical protein